MDSSQPIVTSQTTTSLSTEIYVRSPTQFILENYASFLPEWKIAPQTVVIMLLASRMGLLTIDQQVQFEKQRLRKEFFQLGQTIQSACQSREQLIAIIDPQDGRPVQSPLAQITVDVVAVVHQLLKFRVQRTREGCKILNHPIRKTAIYPSLLLSSGDSRAMYSLLQKIVPSSAQ